MAAVTVRASGPLDARQAWDRYVQPSCWPSWAPQISRVEYPFDRLTEGARGRVFGPLGVHLDFVVDAVDEDAREWAWTVRFGPLRMQLAHGVAAVERGASTWLRLRGPLPVVLAYVPLARFALHRLVH